jgi:hypothetical protein
MASTWTMTDAWVFAAVAHEQPPAVHKLTEIIAIADGINHDVLREQEFTNSVARLIAAGLIDADVQGDRYAAHPRVELHIVCDSYATHKHPGVQAWAR